MDGVTDPGASFTGSSFKWQGDVDVGVSASTRRGVISARGRTWSTPIFAAASLAPGPAAIDAAELATNGIRAVWLEPVACDALGIHAPFARTGAVRALVGESTLLITGSGSRLVGLLPRRGEAGSHGRLLRVRDDTVDYASPLDGSPRVLSPAVSARLQAEWSPDLAMLADPVLTSRAPRGGTAPIDVVAAWRTASSRHLRERGVPILVERQGAFEQWDSLAALASRWQAAGVVLETGTFDDADGQAADIMRIAWWDSTESSLRRLLEAGADVICSAVPVRLGRAGLMATPAGWVDVRHSALERRLDPVVVGCGCTTCLRFSGSYLRHLFVADELLGYRLLTLHNLWWAARSVEGLALPNDASLPPVARAEVNQAELQPHPLWTDPL